MGHRLNAGITTLLCALTGCAAVPSGGGAIVVGEVTLTPGVVPTVATASWATEGDGASAIEWGDGAAFTQRTALSTGTHHQAVLWGLPEGTAARLRVVDQDGSALTEDIPWTTGYLPDTILSLDPTGSPDPTGDYLFTSVGGLGYAVEVLDAAGRPVWGWDDPRGYLVSRARLSRDRTAILYNAFWMDLYAELGEIVRVSLDGSTVTTVPVPLQSHDFVELADGTLATYVLEARDVDGTQYVADKLVEITPDGTWTTIWNAWDDPTTPFQVPTDLSDLTWSHANALDWDDPSQTYRVGLRNLDTILTVTRDGAVLDHLGGSHSDWSFPAGTTPFDGQHQFEIAGERALVFDNGPEERLSSQVIEYALDATTGTATEVWSYRSDPPTYVYAGGDVHRDRLGATWVTWTTAGQVQRVDGAGRVEMQLDAPLGYGIAFTTWEASLTPP